MDLFVRKYRGRKFVVKSKRNRLLYKYFVTLVCILEFMTSTP